MVNLMTTLRDGLKENRESFEREAYKHAEEKIIDEREAHVAEKKLEKKEKREEREHKG